MALYTVKNTMKTGSVFIDLRGAQTIHQGKSKTIELSDADRNGPAILALEQPGHISVEPYKPEPQKAQAEVPKVEAEPQKPEVKAEPAKPAPATESAPKAKAPEPGKADKRDEAKDGK